MALGGPVSASWFVGGTFMPSGTGTLSGDYLAFGQTPPSDNLANATIYTLSSASGTPTLFYTDTSGYSQYQVPVVAPAGWGAVGGDVLVPEGNYPGNGNTFVATIEALSPDGQLSTFATLPDSDAGFGTLFAPAGFIPGTSGDVLLVSDYYNGNIYWVGPDGSFNLFTTVPLSAGQVGLRQMAFAPAGFGSYGGDLFISVSGSNYGGGTYGEVEAINSAGQVVGVITEGTVNAPFDPRGLYFANSDQLLIADSDPSILAATPAAVTPTPEPGSAVLVMLGMAGLLAIGKARNPHSAKLRMFKTPASAQTERASDYSPCS